MCGGQRLNVNENLEMLERVESVYYSICVSLADVHIWTWNAHLDSAYRCPRV